VKKALYSVVDLDRVVKFLDGLNKLARAQGWVHVYEEILSRWTATRRRSR
jgi:hypothetical protein